MADSAALLVDEILPHQAMRQWVLSFPFPLRFLFASNPKAMTGVLGIVYRAIGTGSIDTVFSCKQVFRFIRLIAIRDFPANRMCGLSCVAER